jgi:hypothetical protein
MRIVSLLIAVLTLSVSWAQEEKKESPRPEQRKIPAALAESEAVLKRWQADAPSTLAEAHTALERMLSPQTLAEIDAMPSEGGMIKYHFGLGLNIRNGWGLWAGSPLAKHMRELGFIHPDDMSGVILGTFWCKRHGQDFRLKERAEASKKAMEAAMKADGEEKNRVERAKAAIRNMMMGLQFKQRDVPTVPMPDHTYWCLRARFLSPFRAGVFLTVYSRTSPRDNTFVTPGYYFARTDRQIHRIRVLEVNEVHSTVVAGSRAWFAGTTNGKTVLVGVSDQDRITLPLPEDGAPPQLAIDGQSLLAVYPQTIYRLTDRTWTLVHSGNILLPRSGPPPHLHGNMIFFRDEGRNENAKRLWWLTLGEQPTLTALDHDTGLVGPEGPRWENSFSCCVTENGDLWACVGEGYAQKSLLRRSREGSYSIAIVNNSVQFTGALLGSRGADQGLSVSAVTALSDDTLLLAGETGLYRLKGNELVQDLAFANTREQISPEKGIYGSRWHWDASNVLVLDDKAYFISATFGGVYLLSKGSDGQWSFLCLDEKLGDPVTW